MRTDYLKAHKAKDVPGLSVLLAHIFPRRVDCEAYLLETFDITELLKFIEEENKDHPEQKTTLFHCILYAVAKMVRERPKMNRFIQGQQYWQREKISFSFIVRRRFKDESEESLMVLVPEEDDNVFNFTKKVVGDVKEMRKTESATTGLNGAINSFGKVPRIFRMIFIRLLRWADFWGLVPKAFQLDDSNYTSVMFTNLGSVKCPAIYHHLNDYGTNSIMISIGVIRKEMMLMEDGTQSIRDVVDLGITIDERIGDGFYFARSLKLVKYIFAHPEMLREPLSSQSGFDYK